MSDKYPGGFVTAGAPAGFSVAFDGTGDYLSTPSATALQLTAATAFTIEAWAYPTSFPNTDHGIIGKRAGGNVEWQFFFKNDKTLRFYTGLGDYGSGTAISGFNQWVHCAVTWDLTTLRFFINGVLCSTTHTGILFNTPSTADVTIGADYAASELWYGYLSNVRLVKGTALYTTTFTPPTQLFPVTNTSILACQSPTLIDNSTNNFTLTTVGDAKVSNFTPFAGYQGFNPALGAAAGGVWTIDESAYYQQNRLWPIYDPYFNQTTLMLHGNGTNAAQNNTFLDSSVNNFTITRNGNTTQGSFSPFSQTGWSAFNVGTSSYCQLNNADYSISTGDFTIEFWMFVTSDKAATCFASAASNTDLTVAMNGGSAGARFPYLEYATGGTTFATAFSNYLNTWTHVAFVRSSGTVTVYQNGVAITSASKAGAVGTTANLKLLRNSGDANQDFPGYMSNFRITKSAVYTSNFTPSTAPLTGTANTILLTFQSNSFVDNSAINATVTPTLTAIQAFSPFVPAYITPTTYSNTFDGTGDYLTVSGTSTACSFPAGTDFTIECWFYNKATTSQGTLWSNTSSIGASESLRIWFGDSINTLVVWSTYTVKITSSAVFQNNVWYHVAVVRNGTTLTLYQNGVNVGSASNNQSFTADDFTIGSLGRGGGPYPMNGVVSNLRVVKGTALYTANFTPPTEPLTAISGTQLLTCQSSTFKDNSTNNFTVTPTGDTQIIRGVPFSSSALVVDQTTLNSSYSTSLIGGSGYFDGTGDYLSMTSGISLGSGNFTIEGWVYLTAAPGSETTLGSSYNYATSGFNGNFVFRVGTGSLWVSFDGTGNAESITGTYTWQINTWIHMAWVRSGTTLTVYRNGVSIGSGTVAKTLSDSTNGYVIGAGRANGSIQSLLTGYISGLRTVVGTALYTQAFAPPVAPPTPTNLTNNGTQSGTLTFVVGSDAPNTLYYVCQNHSAMAGVINIVNSGTYEKVYAVTANGSSNYVINGSSNPTLTLVRGETYTFNVNATGHPFWITKASGAYSAGNVYLGTALLTNFTNGAIFDNTAKNVLETVGNAQISTTQSKFGGTSMSFPTTNGNYIISPPNQPNLLFGTGQFTVEAWVYPTAFTNSAAGAFGYGLSGGYVDWNLEINTSGAVLYIDNDTGRFTSSSNLSANTWTHLCVVRTSSAVTMYFNGVSVGTYGTINNISGSSTSARLYVGTGAQSPSARQFVGFIDDLRITKGVARYTTNFTPPTSQLQDQ